jgi:DNA invertase Pin-like site-specific DNA recombinase
MKLMTNYNEEDLTAQTTNDCPRAFVQYIRVSTKKQMKGISLDAQQHTLNTYVEQKGGMLLEIFQDVCSAYDPNSSKRPGLQAAISKCRATGADLLVIKVDRFSRNVSILEDLDLSGIRIVSVAEGIVGKDRLRSLIQSAQNESAEASRNSKDALAKRKAAGKRLGNTKNLSEAQQLGTQAVKNRKANKISELSGFIATHPEILVMTWQARVELLNASGHANIGNTIGPLPAPWSRGSLRKPFKEALNLLTTKPAPIVSSPVPRQPDHTDRVATPVVALRASVKPSGITTAGPGKIESQGALQSLPGLTTAASAPVIEIAAARPVTLVPPVTVGPIFERRPLTSQEKNWLFSIMQNRGLSNSQVMDELGMPRLNGSLWMSVSQGTNVSEEMLGRLSGWFQTNAGHIQEVA